MSSQRGKKDDNPLGAVSDDHLSRARTAPALGQPTPPLILLNSNPASESATPSLRSRSPSLASPAERRLEQDKKLIYKRIHVDTHKKEEDIPVPPSRESVSFDTIALEVHKLDEDHQQLLQQQIYDEPRGRSPLRTLPRSMGRSPSGSSSPHRNQFNQLSSLYIEGRLKADLPFPTQKTLFQPTLQVSKVYNNPTNDARTLLVYVTGRRHTWVALDYAVAHLLRENDHLVVLTRVPSQEKEQMLAFSSESCRKNREIDPEVIRRSESRITKYVERIVERELPFKLSTEVMYAESTQKTLEEAINVYQPHSVVVSYKPNTKFSDSLTHFLTKRVSDRLVKKAPTPIIVVPVLTMNLFEQEFFEKVCSENNWTLLTVGLEKELSEMDEKKAYVPDSELEGLLQKRLKELALERSQTESSTTIAATLESAHRSQPQTPDHEDEESMVSEVSEDEYLAVTDTVQRMRHNLTSFFDEREKQATVSESYFLDGLNMISDETAKVAEIFDTGEKDDSVAGLVRALAGMPPLEKHKSMLDVLEDTHIQRQKTEAIKSSSQRSWSDPGTVPKSSLKFDLSHPKNKATSRPTDLRKTKSNTLDGAKLFHAPSNGSDNGLMPSLSHDTGSDLRRLLLTRGMSESQVSTLADQESGGKRSKRGFLSGLFSRKKK